MENLKADLENIKKTVEDLFEKYYEMRKKAQLNGDLKAIEEADKLVEQANKLLNKL